MSFFSSSEMKHISESNLQSSSFVFLLIIPSVSPNNKSGSILLSPKNSKVDPLRWHLSSISQQNLSPIFLTLQPWLSQYENDKACSMLCSIRQHYIVGVPQGLVFGPSVVLYIKRMSFRSEIILLSFYIFAKQHINSHTYSKITVSLGLQTITVLVREMDPLFQPAKHSHPQDRFRHCQQLHYLPPTCSGDPK